MPDVKTTTEQGGATPDVDPQQFHLAFERLRAEIDAVSEADLELINLDIPTTVATVLGAEIEVRPLRASLAELPSFDMHNVDQLRDRALALGHAHSQFRIADGPRPELDELVEEMIDVRDRFHSDASALVRRGLLDGERVDKLRGGNGHRMLAFDVIGLVDLFLESWERIQGKAALEVKELEEARAKGNRLIAAVGLRDQAPAVRHATALTRQKAYTLLVRAYDETRHGIAFVRRREGDVDTITPSLYAGRSKRPPETPVAGAKPPAAQAQAVTAAQGIGSADVPAGFPGAAPLTKG